MPAVELLVEPWELGIRKAKEFLWTGESSTPRRPGGSAWSTGWCPGPSSTERVDELADRVALVPPVTAQVVKDSLNHTATLMGKDASWKYHFMAHHWMHNTETATSALRARQEKTSMSEVFAEHRD